MQYDRRSVNHAKQQLPRKEDNMKDIKQIKIIFAVILGLLMIFLSIYLATAEPNITINYTNNLTYYQAQVYQGLTSTFLISITNNGTYNIQSLTGYTTNPYFNFGTIYNLSMNQTQTLNFTIKTDRVFQDSIATAIQYDYLLPYEADPNTVTITIDSTGFHPNNISAYEDKTTVLWQNNDNVTHTINSLTPAGLLNFQLAPTQSQSRTFGLGNIQYYDTVTGYAGTINVISKTLFKPTHSSSYDKPFLVQLSSLYRPADVEMELYTNNVTSNWNDEIQGVLRVTNKKNETAYNVKLELIMTPVPSNITYSNNTFNLLAGEYKIINFKIKSDYTNTNQTNKTQTYKIQLTGANINPNEADMNVFIRYFNFESGDLGLGCTVDWVAKKKFCDAYPTSQYCITEAIKQNVTVEVYKCPAQLINLTQDDFDRMVKSVQGLESLPTRMENRYKDTDDVIKSAVNSTNVLSSQITAVTNDNQNLTAQILQDRADAKQKTKTTWIVVITILIIVAVAVFIWYYWKKQAESKGI